MDKEALKLALEALKKARRKVLTTEECHAVIMSIKEALAQPEQEPVAYPEGDVVGPCICGSWPGGKCLKCPRITTPPQRTWVGLTDQDRQEVFESMPDMLEGFLKKWGWLHFSKATEAKLKEKNT